MRLGDTGLQSLLTRNNLTRLAWADLTSVYPGRSLTGIVGWTFLLRIASSQAYEAGKGDHVLCKTADRQKTRHWDAVILT